MSGINTLPDMARDGALESAVINATFKAFPISAPVEGPKPRLRTMEDTLRQGLHPWFVDMVRAEYRALTDPRIASRYQGVGS